jgi:Mn2+/Fe2+ NRAMP family transporter
MTQKQAAEFLNKKSKFKSGLWKGFKSSRYIVVVVFFWLLLLKLGVLPDWLVGSGILLFSLLLFLLAIPLSIFFRLDQLMSAWNYSVSPESSLFIALLLVCLNLSFLGGIRSFFRRP